MGLDWERLSLSGYLEAIWASDPASAAEAGPADVSDLKAFMSAHGAVGHA
jgi:hypothetical protein